GVTADQVINFRLGADVDSARRVIEKQDATVGHEPFGDRNLLLVSATEISHRRPQRPPDHLDHVEDARHGPSVVTPANQTAAQKPLKRRQANIFRSVQVEEERFGLAVFRQHADPTSYGVGWRTQLYPLYANADFPGDRFDDPE